MSMRTDSGNCHLRNLGLGYIYEQYLEENFQSEESPLPTVPNNTGLLMNRPTQRHYCRQPDASPPRPFAYLAYFAVTRSRTSLHAYERLRTPTDAHRRPQTPTDASHAFRITHHASRITPCPFSQVRHFRFS
jgi:hypothetical protein